MTPPGEQSAPPGANSSAEAPSNGGDRETGSAAASGGAPPGQAQQGQRRLAGASDGGSRKVSAPGQPSMARAGVNVRMTRRLLDAGVFVEPEDEETLPVEASVDVGESSPVDTEDEQGEGEIVTWPMVEGSTVLLKNSLMLYPCKVCPKRSSQKYEWFRSGWVVCCNMLGCGSTWLFSSHSTNIHAQLEL